MLAPVKSNLYYNNQVVVYPYDLPKNPAKGIEVLRYWGIMVLGIGIGEGSVYKKLLSLKVFTSDYKIFRILYFN